MPPTFKPLAFARVNAFAGTTPGIEFLSQDGFSTTITVVVVSRNNSGPGNIAASVLSNGSLQVNNFTFDGSQVDSPFSILVYEATSRSQPDPPSQMQRCHRQVINVWPVEFFEGRASGDAAQRFKFVVGDITRDERCLVDPRFTDRVFHRDLAPDDLTRFCVAALDRSEQGIAGCIR